MKIRVDIRLKGGSSLTVYGQAETNDCNEWLRNNLPPRGDQFLTIGGVESAGAVKWDDVESIIVSEEK